MRIGIQKQVFVTSSIFLALVSSYLTQAQSLPPAAYYSSVTNQSGATLKSALHEIIKGHTVISYSADTAALCTVDADPTNPANVILIYSGYSVATNTYPNWNKEHMWLESFGASSGSPHSDLWDLRACESDVNGARGVLYYDYSTPPVFTLPAAPGSSYDTDSWEPRDGDKGLVARACLYMTTRYDGTGGDLNLQLADVPDKTTYTFAKLSTMLEWNRRFPPADWERTRNGLIYQLYQHNRNPYVDNPDFADRVFLGVDGFTAWKNTHFSSGELTNPAVSSTIAAPAGDGIPNLAKYVLGHDPHVADPSTVLSVTNEVIDGTNYVYFTHHLNHYLSDATLNYQTSTDVVSWADVNGEVTSITQIDPQEDLVTVRFPVNEPSRFFRFRVNWVLNGPLTPVIVSGGSTLLAESCSPANGIIDPGETVTVSFSLQNFGSTNTANLVATLLATNGVVSPSGPQTYGVIAAGGPAVSNPFTFTASGPCGGSIIATLQLQDGTNTLGNVTYGFSLGQSAAPLVETFDDVTAPDLPFAWATSASGSQSNWVTSIASADSVPNAVFSPDPVGVGLNELDSPSFPIGGPSARLTFRQNYSLTASVTNSTLGYDGGVLEVKIGDGAFQDILAAGGSFARGGYTATLSSDYGNPLASRQAWSGNSGGFLTSTVNLPSVAAGQSVQLRWLCGSGNAPPVLTSSGTLAYWGFDDSTANPSVTNAGIFATQVTTLNSAAPLYYSGNPSTGKAISGSAFTTASGPVATNYSCFAFAITPPSGQANLSSLSFDDRASSTGPKSFDVQISQQTDFSSIIYDSGAKSTHTGFSSTPMNSFALTSSNLTGTIYFRIYAYGAGTSAGTWRIDNLNIQGGVTQGTGTGWFVDSVSVNDSVCCQ